MPTGLPLIARFIALATLAFAGFWFLALRAAPANDQAAIFIGLFLASFGAAAAQLVMNLVALPVALVHMLRRVFTGKKPLVVNARRADRIDLLGRVVFVVAYTMLAGTVGLFTGVGDGGWGAIASALAFAALGAVLAVLVPAEILWSTEGDTGGERTRAARERHAQALRDGDPVAVAAQRTAKKILDTFIEDERGK